ncbi:ABC transporter substrate-binding protein [Paenibacillus sp. HJGM_3]|uniref:ABC transporter substrate-binding protein n=1 Tax=Paenibacillus sp. HJGM_3 TaxID=3379816 RepID=UPI0038591571
MTKLVFNTSLTEEQFQTEIAQPVYTEFPSIRLEYRREDPHFGEYISNWSSVGEYPDIQLWPAFSTSTLIQNNLCRNLEEMSSTTSSTLDRSRFESGLLDLGLGTEGELFALPYCDVMKFPMFYNKDIFDEAGVPYPRDGMTWADMIELAHLLAQRKPPSDIVTLDLGDWPLLRMQQGVTFLHPITGVPTVAGDAWQSVVRILRDVYSIPGNLPMETKKLLRFNGVFVRERRAAMAVICASCFEPEALDFRWDVVSYPTPSDSSAGPNIPGNLMLSMSASCRERTAAHDVIAYLLSDEFQAVNCRNGTLTSLRAMEIRSQFGLEVPLYANKNRQAFYLHIPAAPPLRSLDHVIKLERDIGAFDLARRVMAEMVIGRHDPEWVLAKLQWKLVEALEAYSLKSVR